MEEKTAKEQMTLETVQKNCEKEIRYYDPAQKPFSVYGVMTPDAQEDRYRRLPCAVAATVNEVTKELYANTSGGRIRFRTDSKRLYLKALFPRFATFKHFAQSGASGFSVYVRKPGGPDVFSGIFMPGDQPVFDGSMDLGTAEWKEITIYMPLYNDVDRVFIGLDETACVEPDSGYAYAKPVVFYGSSITQGGCASRPGSEYAAILSRRLCFDYVNLGFSGGARGEPAIAQYIKTLPMQAFVMDYDHNAPSPEHLRQTHAAFFRIIRNACPQLPIILLSKPSPNQDEDNRARFAVIRETYENAWRNGDQNVYLLDGARFFASVIDMNDPTVDLVHPTDLGFFLMAQGIEPCLRDALRR